MIYVGYRKFKNGKEEYFLIRDAEDLEDAYLYLFDREEEEIVQEDIVDFYSEEDATEEEIKKLYNIRETSLYLGYYVFINEEKENYVIIEAEDSEEVFLILGSINAFGRKTEIEEIYDYQWNESEAEFLLKYEHLLNEAEWKVERDFKEILKCGN